MKAIVAVDENWGIGHQGKLLVSIPADMRFFREKTTGHVVVMGRRTLESMPGGKPLSDRVNIVMTRKSERLVDGALVVHDEEELLEALQAYEEDEVYVIGGEEIYSLLLPHCDEAFVTKIDYAYQADAHFPNLDADPTWVLAEESEEQTYFDLIYTFRRYTRVSEL